MKFELYFTLRKSLIWISFSVFLLSICIPFVFLSSGNSTCNLPISNLYQYGDTYTIKEGNSSGCFIKGVDKDFEFSLGNLSTSENTLHIYDNNSKIGEWRIKGGYTEIRFPSERSIANLRFQFEDPLEKGDKLYLFQKKTTEYRFYYKVMIFLLFISLITLSLNYDIVSKKYGQFSILLFLTSYSFYYIIQSDSAVPYVGDEPHYLVLGESLIEDFDIRLNNQYREDKLSLLFRNFGQHTVSRDGIKYPLHYPLLSAYISFAFLNQNGEVKPVPIIVGKVLILICSSLLSCFLLSIILPKIKSKIELFIVPFIVFGMPFIAYNSQIFPEVIASALLFISYYFLCKNRSFKLDFIFPLIFVLFPFLHIKFLAIAAILMSYWIYSIFHKRTQLIAGLILYSSGILLFFLYNQYIFGSISPYGSKDFLTGHLFWRYSAYLFDADRGLFSLNPLLFLVFIEIFRLFRTNIPKFLLTVSLLIFGHLPNLFHTYFWLGSCPVGRYWIAVYPLIAYLSILSLNSIFEYFDNSNVRGRSLKSGVFLIIYVLCILSALQVYAFLRIPENYYTHFKKVFIMCEFVVDRFHLNLKPIYYSFFTPGTEHNVIYWFLILVFSMVIGFFFSKIKTQKQHKY